MAYAERRQSLASVAVQPVADRHRNAPCRPRLNPSAFGLMTVLAFASVRPARLSSRSSAREFPPNIPASTERSRQSAHSQWLDSRSTCVCTSSPGQEPVDPHSRRSAPRSSPDAVDAAALCIARRCPATRPASSGTSCPVSHRRSPRRCTARWRGPGTPRHRVPEGPKQGVDRFERMEREWVPAASALLGARRRDFLAPLWRDIGRALEPAPFDPGNPERHASRA